MQLFKEIFVINCFKLKPFRKRSPRQLIEKYCEFVIIIQNIVITMCWSQYVVRLKISLDAPNYFAAVRC